MNNNDTDILSSTGEIYKISKGWRFITVIGGLAIAVFFVYLGILPFTDNVENSCKDFVLLLIFVPFSAVIIFSMICLNLNKITIFDDYIVQKTLFSEVRVDYSEIVSFTEIPNGGFILYTNNKNRKIEISMMIEDFYELMEWISDKI